MALFEGMFLIDNDTVRAGWPAAKAVVGDLIAKHGGSVVTARRWEERPLAYPIRGRHRATFLLAFFEMPGDSIPSFHRDLEIKEDVLRYLQLRVEAVPEGEAELAAAEDGDEFTVPEPPKDEAPPIAPELFMTRDERPSRSRSYGDDDDDDDSDDSDDDSRSSTARKPKPATAEAGEESKAAPAKAAAKEPAEAPAMAPAGAEATPAKPTTKEEKED